MEVKKYCLIFIFVFLLIGSILFIDSKKVEVKDDMIMLSKEASNIDVVGANICAEKGYVDSQSDQEVIDCFKDIIK